METVQCGLGTYLVPNQFKEINILASLVFTTVQWIRMIIFPEFTNEQAEFRRGSNQVLQLATR